MWRNRSRWALPAVRGVRWTWGRGYHSGCVTEALVGRRSYYSTSPTTASTRPSSSSTRCCRSYHSTGRPLDPDEPLSLPVYDPLDSHPPRDLASPHQTRLTRRSTIPVWSSKYSVLLDVVVEVSIHISTDRCCGIVLPTSNLVESPKLFYNYLTTVPRFPDIRPCLPPTFRTKEDLQRRGFSREV